MRLFRNYVHYHFTFPKINKRGDWNKSGGGWKIFQKLASGGGRLFGTREYRIINVVVNTAADMLVDIIKEKSVFCYVENTNG